jgi:hypothetical protein
MRLLSLFGLYAFSLNSHDFSHARTHRFYATKKYKKAAKVVKQTLLN